MIFLRAWILMLALDALHSITAWPTNLGYWVCVLICLAVAVVTSN